MPLRRPPERELWSLYLRDGLSQRAIARRYGVSQGLASKWLGSLGLLERRRRHDETIRPARERAVRDAYNARRREAAAAARIAAGKPPPAPPAPKRRKRRKRTRKPYDTAHLREAARIRSTQELADRHGVDRRTMYRWLKREGITALDGRRPAHPPVAKLEAMRSDGMSLAAIGEHYGVSRQRVHQWLNDGPR